MKTVFLLAVIASLGGRIFAETLSVGYELPTTEFPLASGLVTVSSEDGTDAKDFDFRSVPDGWLGIRLGSRSTEVLVLNGVALEGGRLTTSTVWRTDSVHVVRQDVIVPSGVTLTLEPDTVVKFVAPCRLWAERGARLCFRDALLGDFRDDAVGGDTNCDGAASVPPERDGWFGEMQDETIASWLKPSSPCLSREESGLCVFQLDDQEADGHPRRTVWSAGETVTAATMAERIGDFEKVVCLGWTGTGDVPASGTETQTVFTISQDSSLRWLYQTNCWVSVGVGEASAGGVVTLKDALNRTLTNELWVAQGTGLTAEATAKTGWKFVGWNVASSDAVLPIVVNAPLELKARFAQKTYVVRFDANGGQGQMADLSLAYGDERFLPDCTFARTGYVFAGWFRVDEPSVLMPAGETIRNLTECDGETVVMKARWTIENYALSYAGTMACAHENPATYTAEDALSFSAPTNPPGWKFLGWSPAGIAKGSTGARTVTALWERLRYPVMLDGVAEGAAQGGCVYGQEVTAATYAEKTSGYTNLVCTGWVGTGDVPVTGTRTQCVFTVTQASSLDWLYQTNYWVCAGAAVDTNVSCASTCAGGSVVLRDAAGLALTNELWAAAGTNLAVEATPQTGWLFAGWRELDPWTRSPLARREADEAFSCRFGVAAPVFLDAVFTQKMFTVTFVLGVKGWRTGGGAISQSVPWGSSAVAPTVATSYNQFFECWQADFSRVTSNMTVYASYTSNFPYVNTGVVNVGEATGTVTEGKNVATGKKVTLRAKPGKDSVFAGWFDLNGSLVTQELAFQLIAGTKDAMFVAKFLPASEDWVSLDVPSVVTNATKVEMEPCVIAVAGGSLPTVRVAGLPAGMKFTAKAMSVRATKTTEVTEYAANTIYGKPTKSGVYAATVTATTAGKATVTKTLRFIVRNEGDLLADAKPVLVDARGAVASDEIQPGKVTGSGIYARGEKVSLKATANKGYVFNGWYGGVGDSTSSDLGRLLSTAASYAFTMPANDIALTAAFITSGLDKSNIVATVSGTAFETGSSETVPCLETNVYAGAYLEWPVAAHALSATTVKVSGLPTGLKFAAKPVISKVTVGSGRDKKTLVVTNVPANTIYGTPTAASKTDKKGNPTPSEIVVTVTTAGKNARKFVVNLTVLALPKTCVGTFAGSALVEVNTNATPTAEDKTGWISIPCPFTASVDAKGALSGSLTACGKKLAFKASGYASFDAATSNLIYDLAVPLKTLDKTWTESLDLALSVAPGAATLASPSPAAPHLAVTALDARRNAAKDAGYAELAKSYAGTYVATFDAPMPDGVTTGLVTVALTVDAKGGVKAAGTFVDATTFSATATLDLAADGASAEVLIPVTGKAFGSGGLLLAFGFAKDGEGRIVVRPLTDGPNTVSCAAKYTPKTAKAATSYAAYALLENAAYGYKPNAWVGAALTKDDLLSVSYSDGTAPVDALYAFTVTKGAIAGVGKTTNKSPLKFKLDAKTGLFSGTNGKTKVFGAFYPASVSSGSPVSGLGSAVFATGAVTPVIIDVMSAE